MIIRIILNILKFHKNRYDYVGQIRGQSGNARKDRKVRLRISEFYFIGGTTTSLSLETFDQSKYGLVRRGMVHVLAARCF